MGNTQVVNPQERTWKVFTLTKNIGIFSLSNSPLVFKSSIPPRMKGNRAPPTLGPPAGFYLSIQTTPSLFILPAGSVPRRQDFKPTPPHLLSRGSLRADTQLIPTPNTSEPFPWTTMGFPPQQLEALSLHLSLAETFRLDRWLSFLCTSASFLLLWLPVPSSL